MHTEGRGGIPELFRREKAQNYWRWIRLGNRAERRIKNDFQVPDLGDQGENYIQRQHREALNEVGNHASIVVSIWI